MVFEKAFWIDVNGVVIGVMIFFDTNWWFLYRLLEVHSMMRY